MFISARHMNSVHIFGPYFLKYYLSIYS